MPESPPGPRRRVRTVLTTALVLIISIMIVRDLLVRRWGGSPSPAANVPQPSR
jgi:hypothetical protein